MAEKVPQTYANHVRWDPGFHFFLVPVLLINLVIAIWHLVRQPHWFSGWLVVLAVAAIVAALKIRFYALRVQDRVIRLEEQLRLSPLLTEALRRRIGDLDRRQVVALRFASDAETPALVEKALNNKLSSAEIKKAIVQWRSDYHRV